MSAATTTASRRGVQQSLPEVVKAHLINEPVTGVCRRFELPEDAAKLDGDQLHRYVVLSFSEVEKVIEGDRSLNEILEPRHLPIILGTESDEIIDERSFTDVLDLLRVVQPAIYVPDILYNYTTMDRDVQERAIEAYVYHVRQLQGIIDDDGLRIRLIPTNKGWTVEHFEQYQELYHEFDSTELAFYCVQYTGGDAGNAIRKLRRHVANAIAALDPDNVFVIGRLSWGDLLRFEPEVQGACGLRGAPVDGWTRAWQRKHERALFANNGSTQSYLEEFK